MPPKPRALIVEDDRDLCQLIDVILTRHGLTCRSAMSVAEALSEVRSSQFDAILLDLAMPEVSGFDFLKTISVEMPDLVSRVLVVTGLSPRECEGIDKRIHEIIRKPFAVEDLVRSVSECVKKPNGARSLIPSRKASRKRSTSSKDRLLRKPRSASEPEPTA